MRTVNFLGLGFEVGQHQKGLKRSPDSVREYFPVLEYSGLALRDQGNIAPPDQDGLKIHSAKQLERLNWKPYKKAYQKISALLKKPQTLVNWGGDHSVALSTVGAFCQRYPDGIVLWIDAHADLNLPRYSPSGNLHGMPLSILLNLQEIKARQFPWLKGTLSAENLIYLGVRDLDPFERNVIEGLGIQAYPAETVRRRGMAAIAQEIFNRVKGRPLHISFDIDSLSPDFAPSTGISVPEGLTPEDLKTLGLTLSQHQNIKSIDVVEINPEIGNAKEVFQTHFVALRFLTALLIQGGIYDGIGRANQAHHSAQVESRPQI